MSTLISTNNPLQQPTDFWLTTHTIPHVFDTPKLISSLAAFSKARQEQTAAKVSKEGQLDPVAGPEVSSVLFLQVSAAANFFTSNETLMNQPPEVLVDLSMMEFYNRSYYPKLTTSR